MSGIFGIALSGLNAARASLTTTGHNISGVNTPGYHRQTNTQASNLANYTGAGYIGNGVQTTSISRVYDAHLEKVVQANTAMESYYSTQEAQLDQLDQIIADPSVGITPALQSFFESLQVLTQPNMPASIPARQAVVNQAQALVTRMQTMDNRIEEIRDGVNTGIRLTVDNINAQANKIAELNNQIQQLTLGDQIVPNDLLDQRDQAVLELNKNVKATVVKQDGNVYNVFIGNGQSLVLGERALQLAAVPSRDEPQRYAVAYKENNGLFEIPSNAIDGGTLGGLLNFRRDALDVAQNALNRIAIGFAQSMNAQHLLGVDINGAPVASKPADQQEFFTIKDFAANLHIPANSKNSVGSLTLKASVVDYIPGTSNLNGYTQMTNNDYKIICISPGSFNIQRQPDNTLMSPTDLTGVALGTTITTAQLTAGVILDGVKIEVATAGSSATSDSFMLQPTRGAIGQMLVNVKQPSEVATSSNIIGKSGVPNTGAAAISGTWQRPVNPVNAIALPVALTYSTVTGWGAPAGFKVVINEDVSGGFKLVTNGLPSPSTGEDAGVEFKMDGTPKNGDAFTIRVKTAAEFGISDSFNMLQMTAIQTRSTMEGSNGGKPTTSFVGSYSRMVSMVANKTAEVKAAGEAATASLKEATLTRESISGVNMDEEAANLLRFQQAYQASSKCIEIANTLFDSILNAVN